MKRQTQWYVRVKFEHKLGWDYEACRTLPPFPSKEAAEKYARSLFAVEKWEVKEILMTPEDARKQEIVRRFFADHEAEHHRDRKPS